ncbi:MAG: 6-phosphofructokinase, partial [Patulibacter sp.]|nr:6-phosphofructokinase [Patulibacter sp.]
MRFGILTGGGDCPGLNAVIRAIVRSAHLHGDEIVGFRDGWGGVLDGACGELGLAEVAGILPRGGTILGTSRRSALEQRDLVAQRFEEQRLDGLIAIGGNGTLFAANEFSKTLPIVGVPKTIDNDLSGTDRTFGFDTAVHI